MGHKSIEKVAVVIPNLNGAGYIKEAINSLLNQTFKATIIVIENASTDNSVTILENYGQKIITLHNAKNLGFAGGVNTGIIYALERGFHAIALFNNDAVADRKWLLNLVGSMNRCKDAGIITCRIQLSGNKLLDSTGEFYTIWGLPYPRGRGRSVNKYTSEEEVFGASGGASLYRSKMFEDIGIFDDKFFAYYEDIDISFRAQLSGWKVLYNPDAVVTHRQGETSKRMIKGFTVYQTFKNLPTLFWKNVPSDLLIQYGVRFTIAYSLMLIKAVVSGKFWPAVKGVTWSFILIPHTFSERYRIQKNRKVTSGYINSIIVHDLPPDQTGLRKLRKVFIGK